MPAICPSTCSAGRATMCCTSALPAPGKGISTLAIVTLICGSSSRGVTSTANSPSSSATSASSGVSAWSWKVRARRPDTPRGAATPAPLGSLDALMAELRRQASRRTDPPSARRRRCARRRAGRRRPRPPRHHGRGRGARCAGRRTAPGPHRRRSARHGEAPPWRGCEASVPPGETQTPLTHPRSARAPSAQGAVRPRRPPAGPGATRRSA